MLLNMTAAEDATANFLKPDRVWITTRLRAFGRRLNNEFGALNEEITDIQDAIETCFEYVENLSNPAQFEFCNTILTETVEEAEPTIREKVQTIFKDEWSDKLPGHRAA